MIGPLDRETFITAVLFTGLTTAVRRFGFGEMPSYPAIGVVFVAGLLRPLFESRLMFSEITFERSEWPYDIVLGGLSAGIAYYEQTAVPLTTSLPMNIALAVTARFVGRYAFDSKSLTDGLVFNS